MAAALKAWIKNREGPRLENISRLRHGSKIHKVKHLDKENQVMTAYLLPNICTISLNNTLLFPPVNVRVWSCILNRL